MRQVVSCFGFCLFCLVCFFWFILFDNLSKKTAVLWGEEGEKTVLIWIFQVHCSQRNGWFHSHGPPGLQDILNWGYSRMFASKPHKNTALLLLTVTFSTQGKPKTITILMMKTSLFLDAEDHFPEEYCQLQTSMPVVCNSSEQRYNAITGNRAKIFTHWREQTTWYSDLENLHTSIYQVDILARAQTMSLSSWFPQFYSK